MRKTSSELIDSLRTMVGESIPDGYENFLEDLSDSVGEINTANYVTAEKYNELVNQNATLQKERDEARASVEDYRTRYINRFYRNYGEENNKGYIMSDTPQSRIEKDEEWGDYENLFE